MLHRTFEREQVAVDSRESLTNVGHGCMLQLYLNISFFFRGPCKMLAKATANFVPMGLLNWNEFSCKIGMSATADAMFSTRLSLRMIYMK